MLRKCTPDNYSRYVVFESERERAERTKDRLEYEWGMADKDRDDWEDNNSREGDCK